MHQCSQPSLTVDEYTRLSHSRREADGDQLLAEAPLQVQRRIPRPIEADIQLTYHVTTTVRVLAGELHIQVSSRRGIKLCPGYAVYRQMRSGLTVVLLRGRNAERIFQSLQWWRSRTERSIDLRLELVPNQRRAVVG